MWTPDGLYLYAATRTVPRTTSIMNSTSATIVMIHTHRPRQRGTRHAMSATTPAIPLATTAMNPSQLCVSSTNVLIAGTPKPRARGSERGVARGVSRERRVAAAQGALQHLPRRIAREGLGSQLDMRGDLEIGEPALAMRAKGLHGRGGARL